MRFRLEIDVDPDDFDRIQSGEVTSITAPLDQVEFIQRDGLLTTTRRVNLLDRLGTRVATDRGIAEGGVPVQVWIDPKE